MRRLSPDQASFDQRPGALEATRGLADGLCVIGHRPGGEDWKVLVLCSSEAGAVWGGLVQVALTPARAEALAAELLQMAEVCREGFAACERRQREREACQ